MTIEKQMKREDLVALIREGERKERIRNAAEDLLEACKANIAANWNGHTLDCIYHNQKPGTISEEACSNACLLSRAAIAKAEGKREGGH